MLTTMKKIMNDTFSARSMSYLYGVLYPVNETVLLDVAAVAAPNSNVIAVLAEPVMFNPVRFSHRASPATGTEINHDRRIVPAPVAPSLKLTCETPAIAVSE